MCDNMTMLVEIKAIAAEKGQSVQDCADACGVSKSQLYRIAAGDSTPRRKEFWQRMIEWSDGRITPNLLYSDVLPSDEREAG